MREIILKSWAEFHSALEEISKLQSELANSTPLKSTREPLFRGLANSHWKLENTLERSAEICSLPTLRDYFCRVSNSKPILESLSGKSWDEIPDLHTFDQLLEESRSNWIDMVLPRYPGIYPFLIYLRHHGFPSPLLDWTASPFIAALFAFDTAEKDAKYVAVQAFIRSLVQGFSNDNQLIVIGPYVRTHPRHYLQQSRYSLYLRQVIEGMNNSSKIDYTFLSHNDLLEYNPNSDLLVKILIPRDERRLALMQLDQMNLNPYSVYGSEESLMRATVRREFLFKSS